MRTGDEVAVFLTRRHGCEILLDHRAPQLGGYWHVIAGGVEPEETAVQAAERELCEETGLEAELLPGTETTEYAYALTEEPAERRAQHDPSVVAVRVSCFRVEAPDDWEPTLNWEHDDYRWCSAAEAFNALRWPATAEALLRMLGDTESAASNVVQVKPTSRPRSHWQEMADRLTDARARGEIDDRAWFDGMAGIFDAAYPAGDNPRAQSGFGGDEARWEAARRPIVDPIDRDGTFLDIGCANGYLMESVVRWSSHQIEPYGLELAPAVADLARQRLPQWRERIFTGNALDWEPPFRFDFVRTELIYVPAVRKAAFVERLLDRYLTPGGRLILCGYGSPRSRLPTDPVQQTVRGLGYEPDLELEGQAPEGGRIIEIAVLRR